MIAGGILYIWTWSRGTVHPTRKNWVSATIVGASLLLLGNGGVVWAEQTLPSGLAAVLITTVPLWMVLLEWSRNEHVRPTMQTVLGLIVGFSGVILLVGPEQFAGDVVIDRLAAVIVILAAFSWAAGSLYSRRAPLPASPLQGTAMEMMTGGILMFAAALALQESAGFNILTVSASSWFAFLYLIVFGSLIGFTAYIWLLTKTTSARVSTYAYVNPVVAVLLGWALASEQLTIRTVVASIVIISAVVLITRYKTQKPLVQETEP